MAPVAGNLDNIKVNTKKALGKWSNTTADNWYPFNREQMGLIRMFFGKNLETGLRNIQNDTQNAIADAVLLSPGPSGWPEFLGNPKWLRAAVALRAGNQNENEELGPRPGFATGGHVGGVHMKPRGSDTVAAMLTPGEFVMENLP